MPSPRKLSLPPRADDDLADILQYTAATWGQEQADAYQASIYDALMRIAEYPEIGEAREDLRPGLRSLRVTPRQNIFDTC